MRTYIEFIHEHNAVHNYTTEIKNINIWHQINVHFETDDLFYRAGIEMLSPGEDHFNVIMVF